MGIKTGRTQKVTVSIADDLLAFADERAELSGDSRSHVFAEALALLRATQEEQLAMEGYRFYAAESMEFAGASGTATSEAWSATAQWDEQS